VKHLVLHVQEIPNNQLYDDWKTMIVANIFPYILAFLVGAIIMVLEVLGFRLLAPYFGCSVYVSGSLIGVVLVALAMGYYVGGRIADAQQNTDVLMK
jgi:hypothetical protein